VHAVGIVAAAGSGLRLGAGRPKALIELAGRPLVSWAVAALMDGGVDQVVVAVPAGCSDQFIQSVPPGTRLVDGGATRTESVRAALQAVGDAGAVLVHDAARPLTPPAVVTRVLDALAAGALAVVPVLPVVDTTVIVDAHGVVAAVPDRASLRRVQTPQGFSRAVLAEGYENLPAGEELTDDAAVVRAMGVPVHTVAGDELAAKITVAHDLAVAERILAR
jgi:2-C-methyl-D-erythritol 4-phosphate cytidylyltransferase